MMLQHAHLFTTSSSPKEQLIDAWMLLLSSADVFVGRLRDLQVWNTVKLESESGEAYNLQCYL